MTVLKWHKTHLRAIEAMQETGHSVTELNHLHPGIRKLFLVAFLGISYDDRMNYFTSVFLSHSRIMH